MAVSKRTRFEVLRRDNYTCRYCRSSENELTIDHVTPVALGGTDDPSNLVAACRDCNYGKASSNPDASLVANVADDAIRWAKAIEEVARTRRGARRKRDAYVTAFDKEWLRWHYGSDKKPIPRPADWMPAVWRFYEMGLPLPEITEAAVIACSNNRVYADDTWRYFCGVCYRKIDEIQKGARAVLEVTDGA